MIASWQSGPLSPVSGPQGIMAMPPGLKVRHNLEPLFEIGQATGFSVFKN